MTHCDLLLHTMYITVYQYTIIYKGGIAGFCGVHHDEAMQDSVQPLLDSEQEHGERDHNPCHNDDEFFQGPDTETMEEANSGNQ